MWCPNCLYKISRSVLVCGFPKAVFLTWWEWVDKEKKCKWKDCPNPIKNVRKVMSKLSPFKLKLFYLAVLCNSRFLTWVESVGQEKKSLKKEDCPNSNNCSNLFWWICKIHSFWPAKRGWIKRKKMLIQQRRLSKTDKNVRNVMLQLSLIKVKFFQFVLATFLTCPDRVGQVKNR